MRLRVQFWLALTCFQWPTLVGPVQDRFRTSPDWHRSRTGPGLGPDRGPAQDCWDWTVSPVLAHWVRSCPVLVLGPASEGSKDRTGPDPATLSDRGGEYLSKSFESLLREFRIEHDKTLPGSPQQNGRAERFNRTIEEKSLCMLHQAGLSHGF